MTVRELMLILEKAHPETPVVYDMPGCWQPVTDVEFHQSGIVLS